MPRCGNCDSVVTDAYERVFKPPECDRVRACPNCEAIRDGNDVRNMRSHSQRTDDELSYDASKGADKVVGDD